MRLLIILLSRPTTGEKPVQRFPCGLDDCDAKFSSKQLLISHIQNDHHDSDDEETSVLQAPVQTGEGQSVDSVQQRTTPVSVGGSDMPQFNTEQHPSISSPQTRSLLSELVGDLASPAATSVAVQNYSLLPSLSILEQPSISSHISSVTSVLSRPTAAGPSSSSQSNSAPMSLHFMKELPELVNALTTLQRLKNSGLLQDLLSAANMLSSLTDHSNSQQAVTTDGRELQQPVATMQTAPVQQGPVPPQATSIRTAMSSLGQQYAPSPVVPVGSYHSSLQQQVLSSPVVSSAASGNPSGMPTTSEHSDSLFLDNFQSTSFQHLDPYGFLYHYGDIANVYFDPSNESGTQTLPVDSIGTDLVQEHVSPSVVSATSVDTSCSSLAQRDVSSHVSSSGMPTTSDSLYHGHIQSSSSQHLDPFCFIDISDILPTNYYDPPNESARTLPVDLDGLLRLSPVPLAGPDFDSANNS